MSYNKKLTLAGLQHMLQYYHTKLMSTKGQAGGIAELDSNGLVPSSQLPTIQTVNNGTLTIQKNGTTVQTFTANQSSDVTANITVPNYTLTQDSTDGHILNFSDGTTTSVITIPDNNTTYHGGTGISVSGNTITNTGITSLSLSTGSTNGTIAYNISGLQGEVTVKGLGSAAYTASTDYATASHTHSYLPLSGGTLTGRLEIPSGFDGKGIHINASSGNGLYLWGDNEGGNIRIYSPASITTPRYYEIDAHNGDIRVYTSPVDTWQMKVPLQIKPNGIQVLTINDRKINSGTTNVFNGIPIIQSDGIMQIGNEIRFHYSDELPSVNPTAKLTVNSSGTLITSGAIASGGSILINNGKLLYTDVANTSAYSLKFTYFTNPMLQILPNTDNTVYLGHSSFRFAEVRAVNMYISSGTAVTSDRRKKNTINDIEMEFAESIVMGLKPSSFKYNDGESGRLHYGFIAQDVEELINSIGITSADFAPLIIDKIKDEIIDKDADGNERRKLVETGEVEYSLRYEEFIAPMVSVIQKQQAEINELESRLEVIERMSNNE